VAFALATAIADETRDPWSDAALYGAATLTGLARLNDDRHWTSDVFVGALVGHLSARWLSRRPGGLSIQPTGVAMSIEF
jgi:membrane-associated phospholipid phosphatase